MTTPDENALTISNTTGPSRWHIEIQSGGDRIYLGKDGVWGGKGKFDGYWPSREAATLFLVERTVAFEELSQIESEHEVAVKKLGATIKKLTSQLEAARELQDEIEWLRRAVAMLAESRGEIGKEVVRLLAENRKLGKDNESLRGVFEKGLKLSRGPAVS